MSLQTHPAKFLNHLGIHRKILLQLVLIFFLVVGCNLFKLREPESPEEREGWEYPDEPHIVLTNLQHAYISYNIENYLSCLDSVTFVFLADEALRNGPRGYLYENWDFNRERERTIALFNSLDLGAIYPICLSLNIETADTFVDSVAFYVEYDLTVALAGGQTIQATGTSIFHISKKPTGQWAIDRWDDFKTDTSVLSWAEVKAGDY